jgi:RNA polymerase sigma-70 factor (ECF subfamily)
MGPSPSDPDVLRERFEACFRAHYRDVLAFAMRRVEDRAAAEDAASETFATAWRRRDRIPDVALPWLYAVALRVIANQRRSTQRKRRLRGRVAAESGRNSLVADPADRIGERGAFLAAFAALRERDKEVLRLVAWVGLEAEEAAAALDCTPATFRVRLHRARERLAKQLAATEQITDGRRARPKPDPAGETR